MINSFDGDGNYTVERVLGRGSYSTVYKAKHKKIDQYVAIKQIYKSHTTPEKFSKELSLMKQIDHPFAIVLYDTFEDDENYYLVMEYVEGETLISYLQNYSPLPEWKVQYLFIELISCLHYLHTQLKLVHRDLRLENIMIDKKGNIRVIDFGLGNFYGGHTQLLKTMCGSPSFASPEMLKGEQYTYTTDLWSAGCILYVLAVGKLPFEDNNMPNLINKILHTEPSYPSSLPQHLTQMIKHLLIKNNVQRASYAYIFKHPWITTIPNAHYMVELFGTEMEWKTKKLCVPETLKKFADLGFNPSEAIYNVSSNVYNDKTAVFLLLSRKYIIDKLGDRLSLPSLPPKTNFSPFRYIQLSKRHTFLDGGQFSLFETSITKSACSLCHIKSHNNKSDDNNQVFKTVPRFIIPQPARTPKKGKAGSLLF